MRNERWTRDAIQLVVGLILLGFGAALLGGFPGFLIAVGIVLIAGIALKHYSPPQG